MRLELNDDNKIVETNAIPAETAKSESLERSIREEQKAKFKELDTKGKIKYIWDYYKWFFIGAIVILLFARSFIKDYKNNLKPVYIDALIMNSNFAYDGTNTLVEDYVNQFNIDDAVYNYYIDFSVNLSEDSFDSMAIASQQKIVASYQAGDLDVVIGPVDIMEGSANCDCYGDLSEILPQDLIDELKDREYEFYYYDAKTVAKEHYDEDNPEPLPADDEFLPPYFAGVYLDNCPYLNNNGEYGAYDLTVDEEKRPIFTIAYNAPHMDHAVEFLRFLIENK